MKTKILALFLTIAVLLPTLSGCGGDPTGTPEDPHSPEQSEALTLSPEKTSVSTSDGITVEIGDYVLDSETELTVTKQPPEENKEEGYRIEAYDISLGDMHELNDFITIRIPYSTDFCEEGQDPARCVGAKYKNETTGKWEDVLFTVDKEAKEIVIYTDHLSFYGVFYVENEGKRSANITDVYDGGLYMEPAVAYDFAKRIAQDDPTVADDLAKFGIEASSKFFDYADRLDNAINLATVGDVPDWLSTEITGTNQTLFSAIGYVATCVSLTKVAAAEAAGSADKGEVLNLLRDVSSKVTTYWADAFTSVGSGALSFGMGAVLVIDKMLTAFAEEAAATKLEDIAYVYHHYNEGFSGFGHKPMTSKDWRAMTIEVIEKHPNDPEVAIHALESGFLKYASEFFALTQDQQSEVAADTPLVTIRNIPFISEEDQEKLTAEYLAHLKSNVMPGVLKSVETYMTKKIEQQQIEAINKVKDFYNQTIDITITEELADGEESACVGYQYRFAPLDGSAIVGNWTGKWNGKPVHTSATLIGFMTAGLPHTIEFFAPDADLNTAKPEFTVPFVIDTPEINVQFSKGPSVDELVGTYSGTVAFRAIRVTEEMYQLYKQQSVEGGETGIDMEFASKAECDAALSEMIDDGTIVPGSELTIEKTGDSSCMICGTIVNSDGEAYQMTVPAVYGAGVLTLTTEEGTTEIRVDQADGHVTLSSEKAVFLLEEEEDGVKESFLIEVSFDRMIKK